MKYLLIGRQGKIINCLELFNCDQNSRKLPPKIELSTSDLFCSFPLVTIEGKYKNVKESLCQKVGKIYFDTGKFGHFDDAILVTVNDIGWNIFCTIDFIGHLGFSKPGLTSDLVPIVRDSFGQLFFIGILRKNSPAVGKLALIGGFRGIKDLHLETLIENVISEAHDEAGLKIIPITDEPEQLLSKPYQDEIDIVLKFVYGKNVDVDTKLLHVGSVYTETSENEKNFGEKRVYETSAYTFLAEIDMGLDEETLRSNLRPGDDAMEVVVWNISKRGIPDLALSHQREIFEKAISKLGIGDERWYQKKVA